MSADVSLLDVAAVAAGVVEVYREAFGAAPYLEDETSVARFAAEVLPAHAGRRDFRCAAAREEGAVVGFAYGYAGEPGQWWHDRVAALLGPVRTAEWAHGSFELVTLAVRPAAQRRGLGGRLHDALLAGLRQRTAVLSTWDEDTPALRLYRRRGWVTLREGTRLAPNGPAVRLMGLRLPPTR